uniref:Uncharacterized protein n=1 Tax=Salix viminalis TaxID=40686 RepID=A0A6N2KCA4_SALVM
MSLPPRALSFSFIFFFLEKQINFSQIIYLYSRLGKAEGEAAAPKFHQDQRGINKSPTTDLGSPGKMNA